MARQRTGGGGAQDPRRPTEQDRALGARLKVLRKAAGLSQEALANVLGVSYQQVQKYEKGASRVSGARLREAASLLGVTLQDLIGEAAPAGAEGFAEGAGPAYDAGGATTELLKYFGAIKDPKDREILLRVAKALSKS
ncbi:helix-turn-helix domain-containing protein [Enterovirga sp. CN4-39]|uniref:helix-turn-helix domain-containing protein n=1 Tax=Enterovirga sp. CN4-39 TaxID=3400910 RepID=UPI003C0CE8E5